MLPVDDVEAGVVVGAEDVVGVVEVLADVDVTAVDVAGPVVD